MESAVARVYAKINLSLAVTGKRGNLHTLDMIVCPYRKFFDEAEFVPRADMEYITLQNAESSFYGFKPHIFAEFFNPKLKIISEKFGIGGVVNVKKGVPLGAGLGGSSASVAAALKAVADCVELMGGSAETSDEFLLSLGSDVPCMYRGGVCRVRGVGEILTPLDEVITEDFCVKIADGGSDTIKCYALFDEYGGERYANLPIADSVEAALRFPRNDLTEAAIALNPKIGELLKSMKEEFEIAVMSGSGSAVVGFNKRKN